LFVALAQMRTSESGHKYLTHTEGKTIQFLKLRTKTMKLLLRVLPLALMLVGAALLSERPAYAYADPGTGLLAIQAVGSALVAGGWYLRRKIFSIFHRGQPPRQERQELPAADESEGSSLQ
jgi:hypothetical protein